MTAPIEERSFSSEAVHSPRLNRLLAGLPVAEYAQHVKDMEFVLLRVGEVLYERGERLAFVYFPTASLVSLTFTTEDGASAELAMTGHDGLVGTSLILGDRIATHKAVVQRAGGAYRIRADLLRTQLNQGGELLRLALCYVQALMTQMAQSAVCNRHHSVEQRLSRWLLQYLDRQSGNELLITQELIAHMLGVRREAITEAAGKLQAAHLIQCSRGHILATNRTGLEARACECYRVVNAEYTRLFELTPEPRDAPRLPAPPTLVRQAEFSGEGSPTSPDDDIHLQQIDLEMQLAELRETCHDTRTRLRKHIDIYNFAPLGYCTLNPSSAILKLNLAGAILLGIKASQSGGQRFDAFVKPEFLAPLRQFHAEMLAGKRSGHCEIVLKATDKRSETRVRVDAAPDDNGHELHLVLTDLGPLKTLLEHEQFHRIVLDSYPFPAWLKDQHGRFVAANAAFAQSWGLPSASVLAGRTEHDLMPPEQAESCRTDDQALLACGGRKIFEEQRDVAGELRWFETCKSLLVDNEGRAIGILGFSRDITPYKQTEAELRSLAATDPLTQLANRRHFLARLEEAYSGLQRDDNFPVAVLMFDLDHFKSINDTLGHAAGDAALRLFSALLRDELRTVDVAGRLGGEEFAVILPRSDLAAAAVFAERIRQRVAEMSLRMDKCCVAITVSIGISSMHPEDSSAEQSLLRADEALYRAKAAGRNRLELTPPPGSPAASATEQTSPAAPLSL